MSAAQDFYAQYGRIPSAAELSMGPNPGYAGNMNQQPGTQWQTGQGWTPSQPMPKPGYSVPQPIGGLGAGLGAPQAPMSTAQNFYTQYGRVPSFAEIQMGPNPGYPGYRGSLVQPNPGGLDFGPQVPALPPMQAQPLYGSGQVQAPMQGVQQVMPRRAMPAWMLQPFMARMMGGLQQMRMQRPASRTGAY